ncbi:MAG: gluconate:H+ symporter [Sphingomonas bacterium]
MIGADAGLVAAAVTGIGLSILLVVRGRLHPFVALLCGAFAVGLLSGMPIADTAKAVQKGVGDILGGTGLVVALGLALGAMLQLSDGAGGLARAALKMSGTAGASTAALVAGLVIGLPLFFETGLVLLLPVVATAAAAMPQRGKGDEAKLSLMLSAIAGLAVVHALVPPHPGPLLAVDALHANLARTIGYGLLVGIPTAIIAGPLLSRFTARGVRIAPPVLAAVRLDVPAPGVGRALIVILMPVVLIAAGQVGALLPASVAPNFAWLGIASNPVLALLIAVLAALPLLFGRRLFDEAVQDGIWAEAVTPAGTILLAIGAGGALKQVLVQAGISDLLARLAAGGALSPLLVAWLVAAAIRLSIGSATVATITTAGIMPALVISSGVSPEWTVLAIGAGSVFFSHVNDPGFWLVKSYLGTDMPGTFRTWSLLETAVSVVGLAFILIASQFL